MGPNGAKGPMELEKYLYLNLAKIRRVSQFFFTDFMEYNAAVRQTFQNAILTLCSKPAKNRFRACKKKNTTYGMYLLCKVDVSKI